MRWLKWTAISLAAVLMAAILFVLWVLNAESGARWATRTASAVTDGKLTVGSVEGSVAGPLTLAEVRYGDPQAGLDLRAQRIVADVALLDLIRMLVRVENLELHGVDVLLSESTRPEPQPEEPQQPFTLEPPIDLIVESLSASNVAVRRGEEALVEISSAAFAGHWTEEGLAVERLEMRSPQGQVQFAGRVAQRDVYVGEGAGRFRWTVGERTYAGRLSTEARDEHATLSVMLTNPLAAKLDVALAQTDQWPWRFSLQVPRFDPREELLPDSGFHSLAASLSGEGSLQAGLMRGEVVIDDEPLQFDALRFERDEQAISIDALLRVAQTAGEFHADARIDLTHEPWSTQADANWSEVIVPAVWAGQELHTRGRLTFSGSPQQFSARGAVSLGPPGRIADLELDLSGSPERLQLTQFDIVQKEGRLAANGRLDLQPRVRWDVQAHATRFDPGAFAAAWRGDLDFQIASQGELTEDGPAAKLELTDLRGRLRGRPVSGVGDLALSPALTPSGTLTLRSGVSSVRFEGEPGESMDATLTFDIGALNDFVPDVNGAANGRFVARGRWPELSISGGARARELEAAEMRLQSLTLEADVRDLSNPSGRLELNVAEFTGAGLEFESILVNASGAPEQHRLTLRAAGQPLAAVNLDVEGSRTADGWSGSVQQLLLDVQDVARLALREPVSIAAVKGDVQISRACLADGDIELCAQADMRADGSLQASYSLVNVPLSLADAFAAGDPPMQFEGELGGGGNVRRTAEGELYGEAVVESPSGRIARGFIEKDSEDVEEPQTLLTYDDLRLAVHLAGADARATLQAGVAQSGSLRAEGAVSGLGQTDASIDARLDAEFPDLSPFGVLAPQLANLQGRAMAQLSASGALEAPSIDGRVTGVELAVDIPAIGLRLRNGRVDVRPISPGQFELSGGLESGDGRLAFSGVAETSGAVDVSIEGERFLAADIPAAHVLITPNLKFARSGERMQLTGEVLIPEATINLQKLPRGADKVQAASADVVVIDATTQQEEAAAQIPLTADVVVTLGEKVQLIGFGLESQVAGRIEVRERPGEPTTGSGEVSVAGAYKAYGQDLTIQDGRLLFAGTPLDNPRVNIEATRKVDEVTVGLRVRGPAQTPELTVFSDPPMGQADALSYLVAGKPLDDIGSGEGEGDAMQTAARSLGVAAGGLLAKNIGRRLGVDEFAVKDSEAIGGAALTVGQYLSPRLFVSYGVGLFDPGDVVTLSYELSEGLALEAQNGPIDTRAGLKYRIER